jgi:iron complex outermembrane receptor protein
MPLARGFSECLPAGFHAAPNWRSGIAWLASVLLLLAAAPRSSRATGAPEDQTGKPLKQLTLEELSKVEVTTVSKEPEEVWHIPAAIYVLTQDDIQRSGATTLPDLLRLVPGVEVAQIDSDKWSVGIRGFGTRLSRSVLVLIDGRSVYTPLFAGVYWEVQDTLIEDIDRIEVIRGPGGTIWGSNAVNGVINIITKNARDTHGALVAAGGGNVEQGFAHARYGWGNDHRSYRVYAKAFTRGPQFHPSGQGFDDWRMQQAGFRSDWKLNGRDTLTVQGDAYKSLAGQQLGISTYSPPALINAEGNGHFAGGNLLGRWQRELSSRSDLQLQVYWDHTDRHDLNYHEIRDTYDFDLIYHLNLRRHNFIFGAGMRQSPSHYIQTVPTVDFEPHFQTYSIYSGFVQDEIAVVPNRFSITLGTKLEDNSFSGFNAQPSLRLLWTPSPHQTVWAAITRAVRTPSRIEQGFQFTALYLPALPLYLRLVGDGDFSPEQLIGYETGYRTYLSRSLYLDIAAFYNQYNDLLSVENRPPFVEATPAPVHLILPLFLRNGVKAETSGVEIAPVWQPTDRWRLRGSYSFLYLDARNKPSSDDASTVQQLEGGSPHHEVTVQSFLQLPKKVELDLTYRYVGALWQQNVPSYSTADARLAWQVSKEWEWSVVGQNLFQPRHIELTGDPGGPVGIRRNVYGKITFRR